MKNGLNIPGYFKIIRDETLMKYQLHRSCHTELELRNLAAGRLILVFITLIVSQT